MLSRTADCLFWLGRYSERAGNVARGLAATLRMAMLAQPLSAEDEWRALLIATGCEPGFRVKHPAVTPDAVIHWLTLDLDNPSGIAACVEAARRNARTVRTALTVDMWEAINDTWIEFRRLDPAITQGDRLPGFLDWVKSRALLFNGAATDTMLRDDAWRFVHLGTMLERADNTARLLDVRHAAFDTAPGADAAQYAQWQAVLRSVAALPPRLLPRRGHRAGRHRGCQWRRPWRLPQPGRASARLHAGRRCRSHSATGAAWLPH